jgi:hypothetical protein
VQGAKSVRVFFDFTRPGQCLYDPNGEDFISLNSARDFAEATAQRLTNALSRDWSGWSIEVRCAEGQKYFTVPINDTFSIAA